MGSNPIIPKMERWQSWFNVFDLKSNEFKNSVGSNPTLSYLLNSKGIEPLSKI